MTPQRPTPEEMLARASREERQQQRGKLKIFFGATAGVGKTYVMLEAARAQMAAGRDILIGVVETHGRKETEALLSGLDVLPSRVIEYKNTNLQEFDLEGALARHPETILVDELAHTNAEGSKHAKRWQDVEELLNAGINVYSAMNVQHVESLNDVVAKITGVQVRETVPDSIVENASEIELIDLPPDDLLQRLKEGKVYLQDQAERATKNFFRKGNLIALRELALRQTADRVNRQVQTYREEQSIAGTWPTAERLLVCVGPSPFSSRLIRAARRMASSMRAEWLAVYVETPAQANLSEADSLRVKQNLRLAEQLGAEIVTLTANEAVGELVAYARKRNVTKIIVGKPLLSRWRDRLFGSMVDDLIRQSGDIDVYVIKGEKEVEPQAGVRVGPAAAKSHYVIPLAITAACTGVAWPMFGHFELSNLIMVYLVGVLFVALRCGRGPAIFASFLSVAAFDFFFVPPYFTFAVSDTQYLFTFSVMFGVALLISSLTARIQRHAELTALRERKTAALYAMSRELSSARGTDRLLEVSVHRVADVFESDVIGLFPDADGKLNVKTGNENNFPWSMRERGVAQWVLELGRAAGQGTDTLPGAEACYFPLNATRGAIGVLGVRTRSGNALSAEQITTLEAFISQAALAIEIDRLADEAQKAQVEAEAEKSRSALLSSVSHDLRTPLASICGAASTLLTPSKNMSESTKRELLESINDEGKRLARLVSNLLEMTKLEAGAKVTKEWCPVEDLIGSALSRLEKQTAGRDVATNVPGDLPLVQVDMVLMEEVLINLVENAVKYTPPISAIEISASKTDSGIRIDVADSGPGLPEGAGPKLFDKFFRGPASGRTAGAGLGLAICKAIVEAHGGKIWAENRAGGGAVFRFTIPASGVAAPQPELAVQELKCLNPHQQSY